MTQPEDCVEVLLYHHVQGLTIPAESPMAPHVALVSESVEAFNAGDTNKLLTIAAPDIIVHYAEMPEPLRGRETWQQGFELVKRAFPDLEVHVDDVVAAVDKVALRLTLTRASSKVSLRPAARSATSATSSTASEMA